MSSMQTTLARSAAALAGQEWKAHRGHCARCGRAVRSRQWADLCSDGAGLRRDSLAAERELAESRRLDKLPSPDQAPLF
jgi:hypothetical protein